MSDQDEFSLQYQYNIKHTSDEKNINQGIIS